MLEKCTVNLTRSVCSNINRKSKIWTFVLVFCNQYMQFFLRLSQQCNVKGASSGPCGPCKKEFVVLHQLHTRQMARPFSKQHSSSNVLRPGKVSTHQWCASIFWSLSFSPVFLAGSWSLLPLFFIIAAPYASRPIGTTNAFFTPQFLAYWPVLKFFVARLADALLGLADNVRLQPGPHGQLSIVEVISKRTHCLCSFLIQLSWSVHGVPSCYPALLALAQYFVEVSFDVTWLVLAHDLACSCISRVISTISALLFELHYAESHTDPDFQVCLDKIRVRVLSFSWIFFFIDFICVLMHYIGTLALVKPHFLYRNWRKSELGE